MKRPVFELPAALAAYICFLTALTVPLVALAVADVVHAPPRAGTAIAISVFFVLAAVAELNPMPMDPEGERDVTITNVFTVAVAVLFGWQYAVPLAAIAVGVSMVVTHANRSRAAFNVSMYALAAASAALPVEVFGNANIREPFQLTVYVLAGGALNLVANSLLVSVVITLAEDLRWRDVIVPGLRQSGASFAIMAVLSALAANLWVMDRGLLVLLAGPLFTLALYQRSARHSRIATRDARTDNLTGLGNHRAYQAALREQIGESERSGNPFSLCLVDVDDFKRVNDTYGHPAGDDVLVELSGMLADVDGGRAFRFGGDEFAVLVARDELGAYREMERLKQRLTRMKSSPDGPLTISSGIASFPAHAADADALQRTADGSLYWAKRHGKNRSCLYSPTIVRVLSPLEHEREAERNARLRAVENLVRFVDARDPSTATHSEVVSTLAEAIGIELGLDAQTVYDLKLGGLLHDIGKIGLPDAILHAPRALTSEEYDVVKKHPEYGRSLLEGMGIEPVDEWVLHHHENYDGTGYPSGLAGEEIPFGARVIFVADAFEAMTANRPYRRAQSREHALRELRRKAGTQFDPVVVEALERHFARAPATEYAEAAG